MAAHGHLLTASILNSSGYRLLLMTPPFFASGLRLKGVY